jgi:putative transposase
MPQSLAQVWIHLVFSTKDRRPFLQNESLRTEMFKMLTHHVKESGCVSASVGGHIDHVHLLIGLSRTITIAKLVEEIKKETSKWIKSHPRGTQLFQWQAGYGVFSVSKPRPLAWAMQMDGPFGPEKHLHRCSRKMWGINRLQAYATKPTGPQNFSSRSPNRSSSRSRSQRYPSLAQRLVKD